jgi:uncharacterized protein involved in tellurium resistance
MRAIIKQKGETRICELELGQRVKLPEGLSGEIQMFGEDYGEPPQPRVLILTDDLKTKGAYPDELQLKNDDFIKGEKIL